MERIINATICWKIEKFIAAAAEKCRRKQKLCLLKALLVMGFIPTLVHLFIRGK